MAKTTNNIRIHPKGSNKTDKQKVNSLLNNNPHALGIAKKILVTTEKYRKGGGWFSSKKRKEEKLKELIYKLENTLRANRSINMQMEVEGPPNAIIQYFSQISDAYPNWQPEYKILNEFIPNCPQYNNIRRSAD
jgi:hypothetical protein